VEIQGVGLRVSKRWSWLPILYWRVLDVQRH
jgi:hypothetical protein